MYTYAATTIRCIDGDTAVFEVDLGFYLKYRSSFRLLAVDAPEVVGAEKADGLRWKAKLEELMPVGSVVIIHTTKADKYGRWLASVETLDGVSINHALVEAMTTGASTEEVQ
ncbi:MAG TPA: thermonuclease family protein [Polyangiaceae bacterium]